MRSDVTVKNPWAAEDHISHYSLPPDSVHSKSEAPILQLKSTVNQLISPDLLEEEKKSPAEVDKANTLTEGPLD